MSEPQAQQRAAGPEPEAAVPADGAFAPLRSLEGELLALIGGQARQALPKVMAAGSLLALLIADFTSATGAALWWVTLIAATLAYRHLLTRLAQGAAGTEHRRLNWAAVVMVTHGAVHALTLLFFASVPITVGAVITIYLLAITAATMHATAGVGRIYLPYLVVTIGSAALAWGFAPIPEVDWLDRGVFVGLLGLYLLTMYGHSRGAYQLLVESYNIRLQREALNAQLQKALADTESASRSKTRFLASASHDLRQPVHALSLFSGSLRLRPLDARTAVIATQIDKSVQSVVTLLDGLLDISRLDAGVVERTMRTVDLRPMLQQLHEECSQQLAGRDLEFTLDCDAPVWVRTDPLLVLRVLRNLLSNAFKYTERGIIELAAQRVGGECILRVRDTGRGIPEAEHERVFEEFYQLHNPERDRSQGLGLGLAIVRRLAALLEVELALRSTPGIGTEVSMVIAGIEHPAQVASAAEASAAAAEESLKVLVVDDEESIRIGMTTLLEGLGYRVQAEASTEDAVATACHFHPAIVLADLRLRGEDNGMRAIAALRAMWPGLPALLISGDTAPERLREAHAAGIEMLHKPVSSTLLRDSIDKAVRA